MAIEITIRTDKEKEFIDITGKVAGAVKACGVQSGICLVYCPHTTAAITINENADPDVTRDITMKMNKVIERNDRDFRHLEGNSESHIKSSLFGASLGVIIEGGGLVLGTWQSIYFAEFDGPRSRKAYIKIIEG